MFMQPHGCFLRPFVVLFSFTKFSLDIPGRLCYNGFTKINSRPGSGYGRLGGGADADSCVKHIQSRVGIWLAEHS